MGNLRVTLARAAALGLAAALGAFGQSDPLVSKSVPLLLSDNAQVWAFADDGLRYSRLDLFSDPVAIRNGGLPFRAGIQGGAGRASSLLLFLDYANSDTVTVAGLATLDRQGKTALDSLIFQRSKARNNAVNAGVEISSLALYHDTAVLGGGRAGFAVAPLKPEGQGVLASDTVAFQALAQGIDSAQPAFRCAKNKVCSVDSLDAVARGKGDPDSVIAVAIDSSAPDSVWLLIGTDRGLRRGLLGGAAFPAAVLPGAPASIRIENIHADPARRILWVFSGSQYYFSDDHGRSFRKPPAVPGVDLNPASLTGFNPAPQAISVGDTSFIDFNLDQPGLMLFRRDTLLANAGGDTLSRALLGPEDSLDFTRGEGQLTSLAAVRNAGVTAVAVGTSGKGLFYRKPAGGASTPWININSLKRIKGGLDEIITFPTLFSGSVVNGQPEVVRIGYRIQGNANVTITIYNYAMEKVRTLVRNSPRKGGGGRSENPLEDFWDGKDSSGRPVSVGTYYVLVESSKGEKGWGKVIAVRGRN